VYVTATEFKANIGRYLTLVDTEEVVITKNGRSVAKLSSAKKSKADIVRSLIGVIPDDGMTLEKAREERLARYESAD
jgi:prevent-host-death family protein